MKLHELKHNEGARKDKHRKGRGHAAGKGKQAGLGQSGQNKRGGTRPGFEGGQNPWFRRLPKRGFNNINAVTYQVVALETLNTKFKDGDVVTIEALNKAGITNRNLPIKILSKGKLVKKLNVQVNAASKSAQEAIVKAGGEFKVI
ncbi:50S ribosomal protein L15 [Candidatus Mycoplasma mahonii]|uniref:50S ribosomal protein L15 n=1 Tax=Candidatus Mycoplasma mahonii TaxID=3004105 RepID=UPI0026EE37BE|nr:50S ribosomal protein L15 [Candidatus Mycoplasma mahonii]WKX02237.1 50S ribosomal protein L15 [Candidatus Mycoplasma mahonii]